MRYSLFVGIAVSADPTCLDLCYSVEECRREPLTRCIPSSENASTGYCQDLYYTSTSLEKVCFDTACAKKDLKVPCNASTDDILQGIYVPAQAAPRLSCSDIRGNRICYQEDAKGFCESICRVTEACDMSEPKSFCDTSDFKKPICLGLYWTGLGKSCYSPDGNENCPKGHPITCHDSLTVIRSMEDKSIPQIQETTNASTSAKVVNLKYDGRTFCAEPDKGILMRADFKKVTLDLVVVINDKKYPAIREIPYEMVGNELTITANDAFFKFVKELTYKTPDVSEIKTKATEQRFRLNVAKQSAEFDSSKCTKQFEQHFNEL